MMGRRRLLFAVPDRVPGMTGAGTRALCVSLLALGLASAARASENDDLNSIPGTIQDQSAPPPAAAPAPMTSDPLLPKSYALHVEDAFATDVLRSNLAVPLPRSGKALDWQNRTSVDGSGTWRLTDGLDATLSDRFNLVEENDLPWPTHQDIRNDFREGYVTWQPAPETYLELGRINLRHGVALGFNPTDFFKTRSQVDQASLDPSVIREDRLGTGMIEAQKIFEGGSVAVAIAPKLRSPSAVPLTLPDSFDAGFGRTNGENRFLLSGTYEVASGLSPELLVYHADSGTKFGMNVSHTVGQSVVAYAEWAGGNTQNVTSRAIAFGKATGALPASVVDSDPRSTFDNDVATGASWTSAPDKLTLNLEYHYHQAGFSPSDWRRWFANGANGTPGAAGLAWYVRAYAQDQIEPMTQQQVFLRVDRTDAFVDNLELSLFAFVNAYDGSVLTQAAATYYLSDAWTLGGLVGGTIGAARSERGSLPGEASAVVQAVRYF
jgi:hypothetical protein